LQVPRDREGQFHTQVFERYRSSEPQVAQGLTDMFVAGTSTRHLWVKSPRHSWEWPPVLARSVASIAISSSSSLPGASARGTRIGEFSIWMASTSACVTESRPIRL
jgi:hypothetical protein